VQASLRHNWAWFPQRLGFKSERLGVDDSVIQRMLRQSDVATTQNHYIRPHSPMRSPQ
jgi:hypothetical protein